MTSQRIIKGRGSEASFQTSRPASGRDKCGGIRSQPIRLTRPTFEAPVGTQQASSPLRQPLTRDHACGGRAPARHPAPAPDGDANDSPPEGARLPNARLDRNGNARTTWVLHRTISRAMTSAFASQSAAPPRTLKSMASSSLQLGLTGQTWSSCSSTRSRRRRSRSSSPS